MRLRFTITFLLSLLLCTCRSSRTERVEGYVEGEYLYVSSPLPGALRTLSVQRGEQVQAGQALFSLDPAPEDSAQDEAAKRLAQARASLEDARKGKRPPEILAIEAQLKQARAALNLSEKELVRQEQLVRSHAISSQEFDRARTQRDQDHDRIAQLEADLQTARLGSRSDQVAAAEANVSALEAALERARWNLAQKTQLAPKAGLVFDTLYREGEWVPAGRPVVALLPPAHVKIRAFVPEQLLAALHIGDTVRLARDGAQDVQGKISFISPQAEFTPPVIYSRESRSKLVYMVEILCAPEVSATLHPGQPLDVYFSR